LVKTASNNYINRSAASEFLMVLWVLSAAPGYAKRYALRFRRNSAERPSQDEAFMLSYSREVEL